VIAGAVDKEENVRSPMFLSQHIEEDLEAFRVICRQDQECASAIVWAKSIKTNP